MHFEKKKLRKFFKKISLPYICSTTQKNLGGPSTRYREECMPQNFSKSSRGQDRKNLKIFFFKKMHFEKKKRGKFFKKISLPYICSTTQKNLGGSTTRYRQECMPQNFSVLKRTGQKKFEIFFFQKKCILKKKTQKIF